VVKFESIDGLTPHQRTAMKTIQILPAKSLGGEFELPGDKSIGHRIALIGAISEGGTEADNFPDGADCHSTIACLKQLSVEVQLNDGKMKIKGCGLGGLGFASESLDAGNSGTTVRLLSGILAGYEFSSTLVGDSSLSRRPMARIVQPLEQFGARVETTEGHLPLRIHGGPLTSINYDLPVPSAQVKSAVLLAGLHAAGTTSLYETVQTRDHTEIALAAAGARLRAEGGRIEIDGGVPLRGRTVRIPGDLSSAAFFISAALALPESELRLTGVGVNPTRSAYLALLERLGGRVSLESLNNEGGESVADILVRSSSLGPIDIAPKAIAGLIDELPVLTVLGVASGGIRIRGAAELRLKESDRIHAVVTNLRAIGVGVEEFDDGLMVRGGESIQGGTVSSFGDHRVAMAFAVAGLLSRTGIEIEDAGCVDISFPGFFGLLERLAGR
jgi:3-phosphoshikimate 1-carboxyvinyltransferase